MGCPTLTNICGPTPGGLFLTHSQPFPSALNFSGSVSQFRGSVVSKPTASMQRDRRSNEREAKGERGERGREELERRFRSTDGSELE